MDWSDLAHPSEARVAGHRPVDRARAPGGEGQVIDPEDLAHISPYLTEHIRRFGE
nr:transposase [Streptomyces sp. NBC_00830]